MERDGKTYCDKHNDVETALRCSRCEARICPSCAVLTPVGYRCRKCGLERSATHSLSPGQLASGSLAGFALGFISSYLIPQGIGFFLIFAGVLVGTFVGQVVQRIVQRKSSLIVGGITASGFIIGAMIAPFKLLADGALREVDGGQVLSVIFGNPWPLVFACVAGAVSWGQLK
ncbi:MAG: hypothetical protein H0W86_12465 [Armatimonadetes bacterium]|nr:hypothetical protein [Armatimonadota bacterium]